MERREPPEHLDRIARRVIGAAIEVHRYLGPGLSEALYQKALLQELLLNNIEVQRHVPISIEYKGEVLGECVLDFLVEEELIVELKTIERFAPVHRSQLITYLQASRLQLGLLINFNVPYLQQGIRRVIWSGRSLDTDGGGTMPFR